MPLWSRIKNREQEWPCRGLVYCWPNSGSKASKWGAPPPPWWVQHLGPCRGSGMSPYLSGQAASLKIIMGLWVHCIREWLNPAAPMGKGNRPGGGQRGDFRCMEGGERGACPVLQPSAPPPQRPVRAETGPHPLHVVTISWTECSTHQRTRGIAFGI